jgi:maltose/moltooligosaccharide transporter
VLYDETGIYMGIFNFFIVIPEILAALVFGQVMETILTEESALVRLVGGDNRLTAIVLGGISLAVAAALCAFVTEPASTPYREVSVKTPADPPD